MKTTLPFVASVVSVFGLAGCPTPTDGNASVLWLALDGRETEVRLVEERPSPY